MATKATFLGITMGWTTEAMAVARETGLSLDEIWSDIGRIRDGRDAREDLLARCLDGADADRVQGWTEYVDAVVDAASSPARGVKVGDGWPEPEEISDGEVTVRLDSPNGPKATYLRTTPIEAVLAALPAGWTVHESDWGNAAQIDDLTWSVPLSKIEPDAPTAPTKTIVRSARHQGETQALCEVGQNVRVTGQADGSPATAIHDGIVTRIVLGVDGRLRVTLGHGGTNPRTVTVAANEIYVTVGGRPFPNLIPDAT